MKYVSHAFLLSLFTLVISGIVPLEVWMLQLCHYRCANSIYFLLNYRYVVFLLLHLQEGFQAISLTVYFIYSFDGLGWSFFKDEGLLLKNGILIVFLMVTEESLQSWISQRTFFLKLLLELYGVLAFDFYEVFVKLFQRNHGTSLHILRRFGPVVLIKKHDRLFCLLLDHRRFLLTFKFLHIFRRSLAIFCRRVLYIACLLLICDHLPDMHLIKCWAFFRRASWNLRLLGDKA